MEGVVAYDRERHIKLINVSARRMLERIGVRIELLEKIDELMRTLQLTHTEGRPLERSELPVERALAGEACRVNLRFWNQSKRRHG
jgi:sensor histidine kinase regulating citrate/malate metabolism